MAYVFFARVELSRSSGRVQPPAYGPVESDPLFRLLCLYCIQQLIIQCEIFVVCDKHIIHDISTV